MAFAQSVGDLNTLYVPSEYTTGSLTGRTHCHQLWGTTTTDSTHMYRKLNRHTHGVAEVNQTDSIPQVEIGLMLLPFIPDNCYTGHNDHTHYLRNEAVFKQSGNLTSL